MFIKGIVPLTFMQAQRGFVSAVVLIAIVLALIVVGGGAYFVVHQQTTPQIVSENNFDNSQTLPTTNNQTQQQTNTKPNTNTTQTNTVAVQWKTYTDSSNGFSFQYPADWTFGCGEEDVYVCLADGHLPSQGANYNNNTFVVTGGPNCGGTTDWISDTSSFSHKTICLPNSSLRILLGAKSSAGRALEEQILNTVAVLKANSGSQTVPVPGMSTYTDTSFNFSFTYPDTWKVSKNGNVITIAYPNQYNDTLTITEVLGTSVTTSSGKHGSVTYYLQNSQLMTTGIPSEKDGSAVAGVAVPKFYTNDGGFPVFQGTNTTYTDVVYLKSPSFLVIDPGISQDPIYIDQVAKSITQTHAGGTF